MHVNFYRSILDCDLGRQLPVVEVSHRKKIKINFTCCCEYDIALCFNYFKIEPRTTASNLNSHVSLFDK